ncbi:ATP-dependent Clp protease ATP-binding subunit [bacterium]|nr:ATP-dependent Clp protease ATP-binding subunit [bacterium]
MIGFGSESGRPEKAGMTGETAAKPGHGRGKPKADKHKTAKPIASVPGGGGRKLPRLIPEATIPVRIPKNKKTPVDHIRAILEEEVIGQTRAIDAICRALIRSHAGFRNPYKPVAVMYFAGPTGVGKTETARALARALHGDFRKMIKVDCSEYAEPHSIARLIGSPPGYVGSDLPVVFSKEAVETEPNTIILFDEVEKAHFRLHNLLLQIMDEGRLTLARRTKDDDGIVDFTKTIVIMTSNIGATLIDNLMKKHRIGFKTPSASMEESDQDIYETVKEAMRRTFPPEFRNRITEFIVFRALPREALFDILRKLLNISATRFANLGFTLHLSQAARDWLVDRGLDMEMGVRPLVKAVEKYIETKLAELQGYGQIKPGDFILADVAYDPDEGEERIIFKRARRTRRKSKAEKKTEIKFEHY